MNMDNLTQVDANGLLVTDYATKFNLTAEQMSKMDDKFGKKGGDFVYPQKDAEKEFVLDQLINQLMEVKNGQWGKPVKLD